MTSHARRIFAAAYSAVFFAAPFLLDVKITRPKLMFLETALTAGFFIFAFLSVLSGKISLKIGRMTLPVAVWCAVSLLFWKFSPNPALSSAELRRVLFFAAAFFLSANVISDDERSRRAFAWCFSGGTLWAAAYGILQRHGGFWMIAVPKMERVFSTFGNPIFFGVYLTLAVPVTSAVLLTKKNPPVLRALGLAACALSLVALYYTETRASWLGFALAAGLGLALSDLSRRKKIAVFAAAVSLAAIFLFETRGIWGRHQGHLLIWRDTAKMWLSKPIFGVGPGLFHVNFPDYASDELLVVWPQSRAIINDAHNEFVQTLAETGIVGFSILLWVLVSFFSSVYAHIKRSGDILAAGVFCGAAAVVAQNFFSVDMRFVVSGIYLFAMMGAVVPSSEKNLPAFGRPAKIFLSAALAALLYFSGRKVAEPYLAVRAEASRPDFFDERILDAAATISDLEALAVRHPGQSSIYEKLGWVYAKEKRFDAAVANYRKAIESKPDNPGPYNNIGNIYFLTNRLDDAIEYYRKSIGVKPDQIDSRINLALAYYYRGRLGPAADQLKEVLRLEPHNEKAAILMKKMKE